MGVLVKNNAYSTLASSISDVSTSVSLASGTGDRFPAISGSDYFYATLIDTSNNLEVIKVTARATDTLTVVRAQDGTTARSYSSGSRVELRVTAKLLEDIRDSVTPGDNTITTAKLVDDAVTGAKIADGAVSSALLATAVQQALAPSGAVLPYAGTSEPSGWLFCYGQAISRTTYAALFAALGTTYGSGNGSTTFNVPDLRGRVIAGQDDMGGTSANRLTGLTGGVNGDNLGATGGAETHTLTEAQMPAHTHGIATTNTYSGGGSRVGPGAGTSATSTSTGGGGAHNNVQPTIILNYIIKT